MADRWIDPGIQGLRDVEVAFGSLGCIAEGVNELTKARALGRPQVTQDLRDSIERSIYDSAAPGNGKTYESLEEALKDVEAKGVAKSGK